MDTAKLILDGQEYEFPVIVGSEGEVGVDFTKLRSTTGAIGFDPGYGNTGSCQSTVTQPLLGGLYGAIAFGILLVVLGVGFWRGATDLQGHVRAGAQAIVEVLLTQAHRGGAATIVPAEVEVDPLRGFPQVLPGLGDPTPLWLDAHSPAVGRSLGELNLRGVTGAVVLAIMRGEQGLLGPAATERLQAGDVLALAGTHEAIAAARQLLAPARDEAKTSACPSA
jgi:CPA2 family monovalent cation:H+ antiporter-2